ncbi:MAG: PD-(D/E)XK nuclease family protein [Ruminococcus sp.]|nr:PD-(D/E)XK nuclease family protein [Ruminococcus sp.]
MLHFVLGTSGVGKTKYLYDLMAELARKGSKKLLFIVPDQASFNTEKAFLELLGPKLSQNIMVFGFSRLCDYVFEHTGNRFLSFADEGIRNVVMSVAIEQVSDELELFSKRASKTDLCELMLNTIKEYKKCAISSNQLFDVAPKIEDNTLSRKIYETALVYDAYDAILSKSYIDPLDNVSSVCKVLENTPLFEDYIIAIDSYYGFTSQEYDLISLLLNQCRDMYVALTNDNLGGSNSDLFYVTDRTIKRLKNIAGNSNIDVAKPIVLYENYRFKNDDIKELSDYLFRIEKTDYKCTDDTVTVYEAKSIYEEAEFVARNIRKLIVEDGYEYSDIAVISRQTEKYIGVLDTVLDKYGINYFMDKPQDIDTKPFIKFITACFDVICSGFDKDDVLALLKTGLTDISVESISDFENYIFIWDINHKGFFDEFTANPRGFADEMTDNDAKLLSSIENTRKTVIDALRTFYFDTKDATALEISKALMKLIYRLHCKENIQHLCDTLEKENELELSCEQIRIYNTFIEILDKMVSVIGDYNISAKRFCELLHINFANTDISFIPRSIDQVDIACADRSLVENKKAVFIIGAIDGEFPHTPVESGIYSDDEKRCLLTYSIQLSDSIEQLIPTEKYLAYKAISSVSEKLFISYYAFSLSGEKRTASVIIKEVSDILKGIRMYSSVDSTVFDSLWCEKSAFEYYVKRYSSSTPDIISLREYFSSKPDYSSTIEAIDRALNTSPMKINDNLLSKELFNPQMTLSASQVETFHLCKFEYFCKYGLRIRERRQAKIDSLEYGTLMHYLLEEFFKKHKNDDFSLISEEEVDKEVSDLLDIYVEKHLGGIGGKSSRFIYLYYRMKKTAVRVVLRVVEEFAQSKFRPSDFELNIGEDIKSYNLKVTDEISVRIRGSVDRVDIMEADGKKYIRVVDYKTGTKKYTLSDVLYGINLQMLIYMSAINCNGKEYFGDDIVPAGVLYMPAVSPAANVTSKGLNAAIADANKDKKMHGIILDDINIITGMEKDAKGAYIPVSLKGDTVVDRSGSLATLSQFGALFKQVDAMISKMALALCDGDVAAIPAKGIYDACAWCPYLSVCGYNDGNTCVVVEKYPKDTVYAILGGEEEQCDEENMD